MSLYKKRHFLLVGFMSGLLIFALLLSAIVGGTSALDMNSRFDRYVEELFRQEVSANTITLHYTVKDPESYGIQNPPSLVDTPEQTRRLYVLLRKMLLQAFISSNGTSCLIIIS